MYERFRRVRRVRLCSDCERCAQTGRNDIRASPDFYASEFKRTGFRGPLNYYRNFDRNWEIQAALAGAPITIPALYVAGDRDFIVSSPGMDQLLPNLKRLVPALREIRMIPGCGHWTQQERPAEVNAALLEFLASLPT